ncbi:DMT family transporter [Amylibacter sp.]|nr:DMT family transporter [Amylibacter sp.]MDA8853127.1 DMT family transporter [Amylibacter sp.]MDB4248581.1 DMT family transporter [Amylibacter sp.]MDB9918883.1 DMT family transporter [Amylibacter sp.]
MSNEIRFNLNNNTYGSIWMIISMAFFAIEDSLIKHVTSLLPIGQILIIFGIGGASIFFCLALINNEKIITKDIFSFPMYMRVIFEIIGRLFYVLAIFLMPLSTVTVIIQATPLVVVGGAAIVFGEKVGWRRWFAILLGLLGVIVILKPTTDSFSFLSIFAILGMLGFAGRDLASRAAPASLSVLVLGLHGFLALAFSGLIYSIWDGASFIFPNTKTSLFLFIAILSGVVGYSCLMKAMRTGEVAAVTPFRYTRLIFGVTLGVIYFKETLTSSTLLGSILIVTSGLFILSRSKKLNLNS